MDAVDSPRSTIIKALARLQDAGHLVTANGRWSLVDPLLARWIARGRPDS